MSGEDKSPKGYLWFDAEFSALDLESAVLLQVAAIATDASLKRLLPPERDLRLFVRLEDPRVLSPWVVENIPHIVSGALAPGALALPEVERALVTYVSEAFGPTSSDQKTRPLLAGNSVHNDWFMVRRHLPALLGCLHYRLLDVSTLKTQWEQMMGGKPFEKDNHRKVMRFFREAVLDPSLKEHDAYFDIQASIAELAFYRDHWKKK